MDEFKKKRFRKTETNDTHNTFYQIAMYYKEKEKAFIKQNFKCGMFSRVFYYKTRGSMTEIFSTGLQKTDKGLKA